MAIRGVFGNIAIHPGGPCPTSCPLGGHHTFCLSARCHTHLSRHWPLCGTSLLSCHLQRGTLRPLREGANIGSHVPRGPRGEVKARLCPPWVASCQPGPETPESGARLSPTAPCPHAHARGAGTPRLHAPGPVEALACGPGSEPLIRRWQLSREPFNVVRWYFSGFFSEGKS